MCRLGNQVLDVVVEHLATLRDQPAVATLSRTDADRLIASPPPAEPTDFSALIATLRERVFPYAAREPHPGFVAYVPSCPTFPAILGDWLATGYNFFAGVWSVASGPNEVELVVLEWFRQWLGMPAGTRGLLTSGGSAANLTAMIAARHTLVGDDATRIPRLTVYLSDQTHSSMVRAAWMAGIPRAHVRMIPTDEAFRLRMDLLEQAIERDRAEGLLPMMIVANAGATNTGAVDPMPAMADLRDRTGVWMHVDAAYGGFSVLTARGAQLLTGIERADSVTMDPHKWLYVPFECGCLMAREPARLKSAFQIFPDYLKDVEVRGEEVNFADYGEQLTRSSRALKVWLVVNYFGTTALSAAMDHAMDLATYAEQLVHKEETLEILAPAQLGVLCFRVHPHGLDDAAELDALNERINSAVNAGGRYFISSTRLRGAFSLRICVLGFRTAEADIEGVVRAVVEAEEE